MTSSVGGGLSGAPSAAPLLAANASGEALKTVLTSLDDAKAEGTITIDIHNKSSIGDFMSWRRGVRTGMSGLSPTA